MSGSYKILQLYWLLNLLAYFLKSRKTTSNVGSKRISSLKQVVKEQYSIRINRVGFTFGFCLSPITPSFPSVGRRDKFREGEKKSKGGLVIYVVV